jgi:cytochrome P450
MVFAESMRMYPPIYIIARQAIEDFSLGNYIVQGGTIVLVSPYLIHNDSRFHPEPGQFNPYSWNERTCVQHSRYDYFPFSAGPRSCIGQQYAWMEGVLVLATIAQCWRLKLVPNHSVELEQLINLRPRYGMMMNVTRRK